MANKIFIFVGFTLILLIFSFLTYIELLILALGWQKAESPLRVISLIAPIATGLVTLGALVGVSKSSQNKNAIKIVLFGMVLFILTRVALWIIYKEPVLI